LSAAKPQVYRRIAFLGPGFQPPRLRFIVESPFWGQVFSHQGSCFSSTRLFGARFSAATAQLCRRLAFMEPCFQPPRLMFFIESPFWGQVFSQQGSGLSSTRLFGARFSASKAQVCRRLAFGCISIFPLTKVKHQPQRGFQAKVSLRETLA